MCKGVGDVILYYRSQVTLTCTRASTVNSIQCEDLSVATIYCSIAHFSERPSIHVSDSFLICFSLFFSLHSSVSAPVSFPHCSLLPSLCHHNAKQSGTVHTSPSHISLSCPLFLTIFFLLPRPGISYSCGAQLSIILKYESLFQKYVL